MPASTCTIHLTCLIVSAMRLSACRFSVRYKMFGTLSKLFLIFPWSCWQDLVGLKILFPPKKSLPPFQIFCWWAQHVFWILQSLELSRCFCNKHRQYLREMEIQDQFVYCRLHQENQIFGLCEEHRNSSFYFFFFKSLSLTRLYENAFICVLWAR